MAEEQIKIDVENKQIQLGSPHINKVIEAKVIGKELYTELNTNDLGINIWGSFQIVLVPLFKANSAESLTANKE